jgi:tripartite-type tricarboxylate transporter receptor subunit TctC
VWSIVTELVSNTTFAMKVACAVTALAIASVPSFGEALAQSYPERSVTIVMPYPAGGPTDTTARILTERMQESLGQSIVIENVSGTMGSVGIGVSRAPRPMDTS